MSDGLSTTPNTFQQLMLQWERLAPYNAGQYATLALDVNLDTVRRAWRDTTVSLGLQQIGQQPDEPVVDVLQEIPDFVSQAVNRLFARGESPLRPFMQRRGGQTHVGLIYRHVVADSASIRLIMRGWLQRLIGRDIGAPARAHVTLDTSPGFRLVDAERPWSLVRELTSELSRLSRAKRVRRLPVTSDPTSAVTWRRVELPDGFVHRLANASRRRKAKLNDLFVTAAALACDDVVPHEASDARIDLAVGTIADVRPAGRDAHRFFGLSLGFLQTVFRPRDLADEERTLRVAAGQARAARERHAAAASILRLWAAVRHGRDMSNDALATFYRKRSPLAAGISNVNLNRDWPRLVHPSPVRAYTRISPLGPMLPVVFTPTTLGDTLHLGVTYRQSVLDDTAADRLIRLFVDHLEQLANG
jgi:hypothetical protein